MGAPDREHDVEPGTLRAVEAYGSGVRMALRNNATAYGFSISITAAYGMMSATHPSSAGLLSTAMFAGAAVLAFLLVGLLATRLFRHTTPVETDQTAILSGIFDAASIVVTVAVAMLCSQIPGTIGWPVTAFATVLTYLLVGGVDVLFAHRAARESGSG